MDTVNPLPPLPTVLSQALVARTIELDNEAEHRLAHRTTEQGSGDAPRESPWLVSFALWANVLQYLEDDPVSVGAGSRIALAISANTLRVLGDSGTRLRDLTRLSGVSAEATAMCAGWLERHGCAVTEPDRTASRGKVLRLTPKGHKAQQKYHRLLGDSEVAWRTRFGDGTIDELRAALDHLVGDGTFASSPLAAGLTPYSDTWRARTRRRSDTLPHHPMVLHRGGYPDGS
jgi:DNA-binding MarR family transcriptional regulator